MHDIIIQFSDIKDLEIQAKRLYQATYLAPPAHYKRYRAVQYLSPLVLNSSTKATRRMESKFC